MMRLLKIIMLGLILGGVAILALINQIGISWYPPVASLADGRVTTVNSADVRLCIGARALAALGDHQSGDQWRACAQYFANLRVLDGFGLRYWSLLIACVCTLASALGFALAVGLDPPPARVLRGRQLLMTRDNQDETGATIRMRLAPGVG